VAPLVVPPAVSASLLSSLTAAEHARAGRYRSPVDARRFAMARGWLRHVLGAGMGTPAAAVRFADDPGKPRLEGRVEPHFNLSHAAELALIAIAASEVGVDIEHTASGTHGLEAVGLACTPEELAVLDRLPPGDRAEAFLRLWTAKEAYLKARGVGLTVPPNRVEVGTAAPGAAAPVRVAGDSGPLRWWVREIRPAPAYIAAVAAEGPHWVVELRSTAALRLP